MRWIRKFQEGGTASFSMAKGRGRRSKLSETQQLEIKSYIEKTGAQLSSKKLQSYIAERFGISLSISTSHRLMKHVGCSYITPRPSHYKQDPKQQKRFKKKPPACVSQYPDHDVFFFDESRLGTHASIGHGWFKTGSRPDVKKTLGYENVYV